MKLSKLKTYAPKARRDFIAAVTDRAALLGITPKRIADVQEGADVVVIEGKPWPKAVGAQRQALIQQIEAHGFHAVMEQAAYSWFNRLVALRYMELHGYLDHGYRVLGNPDDAPGESTLTPEILSQIEHIDLPGLKRDEVINLKLESKDEALYRLVLIAQCNALHTAMPFLFEKLGDATELLLPDHLLRPGSILRELITAAPDEDWQQVEIIGWLYQFYIWERKEEVIGKTVKTKDIPAATQVFTPNWIVQYMVQNTIGRQWLDAHPDSMLAEQMPYYIEPAQQDPKVQAQLDALKPDKLDPESLTLLDPACGSGHILVEAYDLFKAMYLERGYRPREIPELILRHNLFGLEIDPRAAQLAGFALLMKARADDPRILSRGEGKAGGPWMNIRCIQSSDGLNAQAVYEALTGVEDDTDPPTGEFAFMEEERAPLLAEARRARVAQHTGENPGFTIDDMRLLLSLFQGDDAQTFGSLIRVPAELAKKLPVIADRADHVRHAGDMHRAPLAERFYAIVEQALLLCTDFDAVVANPPYMGAKQQNSRLKQYTNINYVIGKSDLYGCFMVRAFELVKSSGHASMITLPNWMFLTGFDELRDKILNEHTPETMSHNGRGVWGPDFGSSAFTIRRCYIHGYEAVYKRLFKKQGSVSNNEELANRFFSWPSYTLNNTEFRKIPGSPIAYWVSDAVRGIFEKAMLLKDIATPRQGLATGENDRFLRWWAEVDQARMGLGLNSRQAALESALKWFPYNKGGEFRKWYGNQGFVVNWENDGAEIRNYTDTNGKLKSRPQNTDHYFHTSLSWSKVTSGGFALRLFPQGHIFDVAGCSIFMDRPAEREMLLGCMNSPVMSGALNSLSPTLNFEVGQVAAFPVMPELIEKAGNFTKPVQTLMQIARKDWDAYEVSWDFQTNPVIRQNQDTLAKAFAARLQDCEADTQEMKRVEEDNNRLFIDAYGLQDELSTGVPLEKITLFANPAYRYPPKRKRDEDTATPRPIDELEVLFREDTAKELISYAVGCMVGRYSLDEPGLIYAHAGNEGFDPNRYKTFPADADGIIPITDTDWFDDDAGNRLIGFIATAWPKKSLEENLIWLAQSIDPKGKKPARETLRAYLADPKKGFFDHHLGMYKKRPIYWLLTSGKLGAFQVLVYLHRYHAGTLARVRSEYVLPLMGKIDSQIQRLDKAGKPGTADRKQIDTYRKQLDELRAFDERLHHLADQRIELDLDDGVKVNYGKFSAPSGDILARVKDVTGGKGDE